MIFRWPTHTECVCAKLLEHTRTFAVLTESEVTHFGAMSLAIQTKSAKKCGACGNVLCIRILLVYIYIYILDSKVCLFGKHAQHTHANPSSFTSAPQYFWGLKLLSTLHSHLSMEGRNCFANSQLKFLQPAIQPVRQSSIRFDRVGNASVPHSLQVYYLSSFSLERVFVQYNYTVYGII